MFTQVLLTPLRLAVGWSRQPRLLGLAAMATLVLLRLTIGWHFFSEGYDKYRQGDWDSRPFFANATGPFAAQFRSIVWDADGELRQDLEKTKVTFAVFRDRVGRHYGFDEAQTRQAQLNYAAAVTELEQLLEENARDLADARLGRQRLNELENDVNRAGVDSLVGQTETIRSEWNSLLRPILTQIDTLWSNYETAQNALASVQQSQRRGYYAIEVPRTGLVDTSVLNRVVPYFDLAIGICLIIGLFTPVVSLAACGFLFSVFLSQFPPASGPSSSAYQLIEGVACLVLAATGAGRFAGLDFILHSFVQKIRPQAAE